MVVGSNKVYMFELTQHTKTVVERHHDYVAVACEYTSVVGISGSHFIGFSMNIQDYRKQARLIISWKRKEQSD